MLMALLWVILALLVGLAVFLAVQFDRQRRIAVRISDLQIEEHERTRRDMDEVAQSVSRLQDRFNGQ